MDCKKRVVWTTAIVVLLLLAIMTAITTGRYEISIQDFFRAMLGGETADARAGIVLLNIRLPRIILAVIAGAGLSVAGAAFQGMFSNPLATPDTLGVATGASFGATLGILLRLPTMGIQMTAFIMGILSIGLVYSISRIKGKSSIIMLILAGMVVSALFEALVSLIKYTADPQDVLPEITFWLMGSLSGTNYKDLLLGTPAMLAGIGILYFLRWKINALSLHEDEAEALGVNVRMVRTITILAATMITASVVAMCGKIGWIGLLIPHVSRMIFGNNNKFVIPASIGFGASFLLMIDTLARSMITSEIPISILTAIIGAPFFIGLLRRTGGVQA